MADTQPSASASATLSGNFMLDVATLYAVAFCGPILFWLPGSTEILSAAYGRAGFSPLVVGATCASGQCTLFALLYTFGLRLTARWGWLKRSVDAVAYGKGRKYFERGKIAMAVGAGIAGLPPTVPLFTLGPSLQMKLPPMLIIVFAFRVLRFASCCFLGSIGAEDGKRWWAALYTVITEGTEWRARTQPGDTRFVYQELPTSNVR